MAIREAEAPAHISSEIDALVAEAIRANRLGCLYHLAVLEDGPESLRAKAVELAIMGAHLATSTGALASRVRDLSIDLTGQFDGDRIAQLVALSGGLRAALIAPYSGVAEVLLDLRHCLPDLDTLIEVIVGSARRGVAFSADMGLQLGAVAKAEEAIGQAVYRAKKELETGPQRTIRFQAATAIWRQWLHDDGYVGELLSAVAGDERDRLAEIATKLLERQATDSIAVQMDRDDRRSTTKAKIVGPARERLIGYASEAFDIVTDWVQAVQQLAHAQAAKDTWEAQAATEVRAGLRSAAPDAAAAIAALDREEPAERAALHLLQRTISSLLDLADGRDIVQQEPTETWARNSDLLLSPDVDVVSYTPRREEYVLARPATFEQIRTAIQAPLDLEQALLAAYDGRSGRGDHAGTALVVGRLETVAPAAADQLRTRRSSECVVWEERLQQARRRVGRELSTAYRYGYLDGTRWAELSGSYEATAPEGREDYGNLMDALQDLAAAVQSAREAAIAAFKERFEEAQGDPRVAAVAARIQQRVDAGHLDTADEYLQSALAGEDLPASDPDRDDTLERYLDLIGAVEGERDWTRYATAVETGRAHGSVDFSHLSEREQRMAKDGLRAWLELGVPNRARQVKDLVKNVLPLLGLEADRIVQSNEPRLRTTRERTWLELSGIRRLGKALVPQFGSSSSGIGSGDGSRQMMLIVTGAARPEEIAGWVGELDDRRPLIILLTEGAGRTRRQVIAEKFRSRDRHRPVIIIDTTTVIYLAALRGGSYERLMRAVLPWAAVNPYKNVGGLVPVEMFYGRTAERRRILDPQGPSLVYGGRQLGKSALLRACEREFDDGKDSRAAYIDLKGRQVGTVRPPDAVWETIWDELVRKGVLAGALASNPAQSVPKRVRDWLAANDRRSLLVLLDESDAFLNADADADFASVGALRTLMEDTMRRFKVVFAGLHKVARFNEVENHPFSMHHLGEPIAVGPLRPQAAADLVAVPTEALGYRFAEPELVGRITAICNNQPALIVLFMEVLIGKLLARPWRAGQPPVMIDDDLISSVYDDDLAGEIKSSFDLTLDLDPAYKVMTYVVARNAIAHRAPGAAIDAETLRDECRRWWPAGFASMAPHGFRILAGELVDLGVLVAEPAGYRLRSPNVLRILGTADQIDDMLLEASDREPVATFSKNSYRPPLDQQRPQRVSPLTARQVQDLWAARNQVRVVIGAPASGIGEVTTALRIVSGSTKFVERKASDRGADRAFSGTPGRHTVEVLTLDGVDDKRAWSFVLRAIEKVTAARAFSLAKPPTVGAIVVAPPQHAHLWHSLLEDEKLVSVAQPVDLPRVDADGWRSWLVDSGVAVLDGTSQQALLEATGGWWELACVAVESFRGRRPKVADAIAAVRKHVHADPRGFVTRTGVLASPSLETAWSHAAEILDPKAAIGPVELANFLESELATTGDARRHAEKTVELLQLLGALIVENEAARCEPVLLAAWRATR